MVQVFDPIVVGFAALSLVGTTVGVWMSIRVARRIGRMDIPNERSSHSQPTPRIGGVPMVTAVTLTFGGWAHFVAAEGLLGKELLITLLFALSMFTLGFVDDIWNLSPLNRFFVQCMSALLALWALEPQFPVNPLGRWESPWPVLFPVATVWVIWMLNLFNFMDGIDGLAGGESAAASAFFFLVFAYYGETGWAAANLVVASAAMGFLIYNWPPARVFMGDGGSAFLGAFYGMQSIAACLTTSIPLPVLLLPFTNFILDTTVTLIRRIYKRERWYRPHRTHYYQRMTNFGMSHAKVTGWELSTVALSCIAATLYLHLGFEGRIAVVLSIIGVFIIGMFKVDRMEKVPES